MSERYRTQGQAVGGSGSSRYHRGGRGGRGGYRCGYNNGHHGNYQGHGNWGNTPNCPTPLSNHTQGPFGYQTPYPMSSPNCPPGPYGQQPPPAFGSGYPYGQNPPNPPMGQDYNQNPPTGQVYNQHPQMGLGYNQNPQMGQGYSQNFPTGQVYNQNPPMGQGYNTYQFDPNVPWQPANEPSNPFSQSRQAPQTQQTQQSQKNGGQKRRGAKKPKKSHEVERISPCQVEADQSTGPDIVAASRDGGPQQGFRQETELKVNWPKGYARGKVEDICNHMKRKFKQDVVVDAMVWIAPVFSRGSSTTSIPVKLFAPIKKRPVAAEDDGLADEETLPDAEDVEEPNAQALAQTEPEVCGMCKRPGHEVIQCWQIYPDGFTHGCGVCNSGAHETD
ncbi:hypothetical protein FMEXI_10281 [Fusarium mexicanum]|uniref:Uncharacterized protein n=1 Tax=Fusarium mexicanum TaxID=751941 RepID=A0A8H5IGX0_9HYPO|nr:hypothetical protein FMEXI_10281 [Fusarium mexicanum]